MRSALAVCERFGATPVTTRTAARLRSALYEGTVTHRRAEPAHRFDSPVALPLLFLDELAALRTVHPLVDLDPTPHRHLRPTAIRLPPRRLPALGGGHGAGRRRGRRGPCRRIRARTGGDAGPRPYLGMALQPADPLLLLRPHRPGGGVDGARGLQHPLARALLLRRRAAGTAPLRQGHARLALPAATRPSYTLRYSAPEEEIRVSLDVAAPPPTAPHGRSHEPSPDRTTPRLAAAMVLRRRPLDRAGLGHLLWGYPLHDGAGLGRHLRPGTATDRPRRPDPPASRSGRAGGSARWRCDGPARP